jgi:hypothetical protein
VKFLFTCTNQAHVLIHIRGAVAFPASNVRPSPQDEKYCVSLVFEHCPWRP